MNISKVMKQFDEKFTYGEPFTTLRATGADATKIKAFLTQALIEQRGEVIKQLENIRHAHSELDDDDYREDLRMGLLYKFIEKLKQLSKEEGKK